jgi:Leucine-rich repeat (LRR) protein
MKKLKNIAYTNYRSILILTVFSLFLLRTSANKFEISENPVRCDSIGTGDWGFGGLGTCFMEKNASIKNDGFKIFSKKNETMKALYFGGNRKIFFLPINVSEAYPNLVLYNAGLCSLKRISLKNFRGLFKLQELFLYTNRIEIVRSDTFKDLISLQQLHLGKKLLISFIQYKNMSVLK